MNLPEGLPGTWPEPSLPGVPSFIGYPELLRLAADRRVVVFGGYSGLGYADPAGLSSLLRIMVEEAGDHVLYVGGATKVGIGLAYSLIPGFASELGFGDIATAGIVSRSAPPSDLAMQDCVVQVDTTPGDWSVIVGGRSLMVDIAADSGGLMVYFGGGAIARDELLEAGRRGVKAVIVDDAAALPGPGGSAGVAAATDPSLAGVRRWRRGLDCPMLPS